MKLIVGLGNPGKEYENTRHNIGFMVIDNYASKLSVQLNLNKFNGNYAKTKINNEDVIFLKPQLYMNLSGEVIKKFLDYFKIPVQDLLIINDDLDIKFGEFKLKYKGSSGGHNGLKNIQLNIGTTEYKRIKIGISNNKLIETKDYVLGKFKKSDEEILNKIYNVTENMLDDYFKLTFDNLMNKYN